jgi:methylmalonyl-CoA mutase cobalamin-binding subunit
MEHRRGARVLNESASSAGIRGDNRPMFTERRSIVPGAVIRTVAILRAPEQV